MRRARELNRWYFWPFINVSSGGLWVLRSKHVSTGPSCATLYTKVLKSSGQIIKTVKERRRLTIPSDESKPKTAVDRSYTPCCSASAFTSSYSLTAMAPMKETTIMNCELTAK